jgi:DNA-binding CsgD family transcriptional regulator
MTERPEKRLRDAVAAVPGEDLRVSLGEVARAMPVALGFDVVGIRIRASDGARTFHLLANEGASPRETGRRALESFELPFLRSVFALGPSHSLARGFGMRAVSYRWLMKGGEPIGTISAGNRTDRRPTDEQEHLFTRTAQDLSARVRDLDRSTTTLEHASAALARDALADAGAYPTPALEALRPRERTVLILYSEGLSAEEIGRTLFISPHTVRTHVKNAFRRLGIHSREEAARLVHTDEVARLL